MFFIIWKKTRESQEQIKVLKIKDKKNKKKTQQLHFLFIFELQNYGTHGAQNRP